MSVYVTMRVAGDAAKLTQVLEGRWPAINERAKRHGAMHHRFMASLDGKEICVVDEWETREGFERFFAESDDIRAMMAEAGVTSQPQITFWRAVDSPDQF